MFCCWGVYTETKTKVLLLVIHQQWTSVSVNPALKKRILNPFVYIWITDRVVKFTRIIQLRRDFSEHEINRSGSKTFSNNITLLFAEEAVSQSMNVVLQKKSRAVDCPVGRNRNTTRSFILVINLQFFTCGQFFSLSPFHCTPLHPEHTTAVTSVHQGTQAERGRKSSELTLSWDINCGSTQAMKYMPL